MKYNCFENFRRMLAEDANDSHLSLQTIAQYRLWDGSVCHASFKSKPIISQNHAGNVGRINLQTDISSKSNRILK